MLVGCSAGGLPIEPPPLPLVAHNASQHQTEAMFITLATALHQAQVLAFDEL
ncbi:MAG: hypothetical protein JWM53_3306, partial [bacterium]|nr:hypothetical protein [bacterium]